MVHSVNGKVGEVVLGGDILPIAVASPQGTTVLAYVDNLVETKGGGVPLPTLVTSDYQAVVRAFYYVDLT